MNNDTEYGPKTKPVLITYYSMSHEEFELSRSFSGPLELFCANTGRMYYTL